MTTFMLRDDDKSNWFSVVCHPDEINIRAMHFLRSKEGADSDGGYSCYVEIFNTETKEFTYAYAEYDSYVGEYSGEMNLILFGSVADIERRVGVKLYIQETKHHPDRDWIWL